MCAVLQLAEVRNTVNPVKGAADNCSALLSCTMVQGLFKLGRHRCCDSLPHSQQQAVSQFMLQAAQACLRTGIGGIYA